jgi:hypothetical protein
MKTIAGCLTVLSIAGLAAWAGAVEPPATRTISLSPAACQVTSKDQSTLTWFCEQDEFYWTTAYPDSLWLNVPLQLPDKAVVKGFTVYCTVNGGGSDEEIEFFLSRHKLLNGSTQKLATITTTTLTPSSTRKALADETIEYAAVDNDVFSYAIVIRFRSGSPNLKFHGAKIRYTLS